MAMKYSTQVMTTTQVQDSEDTVYCKSLKGENFRGFIKNITF